MVPRKGQDTLLQAWPLVRAQVGGNPVLLLVGDGPYRAELGRLAQRLGIADSVYFAGPVPWEELPAYYDAGNVFAMPCRTRRGGLDVEGLGIVYLEASATGLPVVGGDSGGAPDAILHGETGYVVPGGQAEALAARLDRAAERPRGRGRHGREGPGVGRPRVAVEPGGRPSADPGGLPPARPRRPAAHPAASPGRSRGVTADESVSASSARGSTRTRSRSWTG